MADPRFVAFLSGLRRISYSSPLRFCNRKPAISVGSIAGNREILDVGSTSDPRSLHAHERVTAATSGRHYHFQSVPEISNQVNRTGRQMLLKSMNTTTPSPWRWQTEGDEFAASMA
jgi:hypothetical protein